ncbi:MAG TPA: NlpC/P60 family protein [Mycobacteriales bacterium]|nr:NlpC/P60 family protein [Mycobacteriales bacterium]
MPVSHRAARARPLAVTAAAVAFALPLAFLAPPAAASHGDPGAGAVSRSKQAVADAQAQVDQVAHQVARAESKMQRLATSAEVAIEAYDGARVKLAAAEQAAATAKHTLDLANRHVAHSRQAVIRFARAAYESGGLSAIDALFLPGGASAMVSRIGAVNAISDHSRDTMQRFDAAQLFQRVVSQQADAARGNAQAAATRAAHAKAAAEAQVAAQSSLLHRLQHKRAQLRALLTVAQQHADAVERAHLAALAAARQAVEAPAPAGVPTGGVQGSGSLAGTISASTGAAAVREAEAQIGKPYQWGGAGPDTFDCSGLVMWAYAHVGVHLDHWTGDQWNEGAHISTSQLRPGDLLFFAYNTSAPSTIHHVGMYIGGGQMVEAPYTGADVRISSASRPDFIGAVRPYQR